MRTALAGLSRLICGRTNAHVFPKNTEPLFNCTAPAKAPPTFPFFIFPMNCHFGPSEREHPAIHSHPFPPRAGAVYLRPERCPHAHCANVIQFKEAFAEESQESLLMHRDSPICPRAAEPPLQSFACRISRVGGF